MLHAPIQGVLSHAHATEVSMEMVLIAKVRKPKCNRSDIACGIVHISRLFYSLPIRNLLRI